MPDERPDIEWNFEASCLRVDVTGAFTSNLRHSRVTGACSKREQHADCVRRWYLCSGTYLRQIYLTLYRSFRLAKFKLVSSNVSLSKS